MGKRGGARPGAGRKTLVTEREVKEQLQKFLPQTLKAIEQGLEDNPFVAKLHRVRLDNAWRVINKFVADRKAVEVSGDPERPLGVVMLPEKYKEESTRKRG